jgi:hypothetical protein
MPDVPSHLRDAGFTDDEIGIWATDQRTQLKAAGFTDDEVDDYLGQPKTPSELPQPLLRRLMEGSHIAGVVTALPKALTDIPRESWQTTVDNLKGIANNLLPKEFGGERIKPGYAPSAPRNNFEAADKELNLTPEEKALYERHLTNLSGSGGVDNPNGSRSTLFQASIEHDGRTYNIPTVWDGKILPINDALKRVEAEGWNKFPSYDSEDEAEARYGKMHDFMEKDTEWWLKNKPQSETEAAADVANAGSMAGFPAGLGKTGEALLGIAALPLSPIQGALRSLVGHPMVATADLLRRGAVQLYGEDRVAKAEELAGLTVGGMTYEDAKAQVDTGLMALGSRGMNRIGFGPGGTPEVLPVGGLPKGDDFSAAGTVIGNGDTTPLMEKKLIDLYEQKGIHPAEAAHDAQTDVTIAQSILSEDTNDFPASYGATSGFGDFGQGFDFGYQFNAYEPREESLVNAIKSAEEARSAGLQASIIEPYFQDVKAAARPKTAMPLAKTGGEVPEEIPGIVGEDFEIKPLKEPPTQEELLPQGKTVVQYSDAENAVLSKVSVNGKAPTGKLSWSGFYTNFIDKLFPIDKAVTEAGAELPTQDNPYQLARLMSGNVGKADHFLNNSTFDFGTYENNGPSLKQILQPMSSDLNGFRAYATARRALELEQRGIKSGFQTTKSTAAPDIAEGLDAVKTVISEGSGKYEKPFNALVDYQNRVSKYLRDSGVLSDAGYKAMLEANQMYVPFSRVMGLDEKSPFIRGSSLQARNPIKAIKGSARDIIDPIESVVRNTYHFLEMAERNQVGTKLIDMLKGAEAELPDAPKAVADMAVKDSSAAKPIADALGEMGIKHSDQLAESIAHASAPVKEGEIAILRDGKRETYNVDPELARAMKGLDAQSADMLVRILAKPANVLRAGSVLTPEFWGRHILRDFQYAFATFKGGVFNPIDMAKGIAGLITKDEDYWNWLKGGGGNISMVGIDRQYMQADLQKLTGETGLVGRAWNVMTDPESSMWQVAAAGSKLPFQAISKFILDPLRVATNWAENVSHLAAFKKQMRIKEAEPGNLREQILQSAWSSRDTAVDAARAGAATRSWNMISAFANITIQDVDRVARAIKDDPITTLTKIGAAVTVPSMVLWSINHDDPDYQELPQWERDLFWIIPVGSAAPSPLHVTQAQERGEQPKSSALFFMRIPKPWGMGLLFGSGPERLMDAYVAQKPGAFDNFAKSIFETSVPSFIPTAASPIIDQFANRSTFTNRTLIPQAQEKFLPEYQYTPYTTELTKELGKIIGAFPGISQAKLENSGTGGVAHALTSPILMENYIRGWSGTLGVFALNAADAALRKAGILPDPPQPTPTLADIPVIRAFTVRYPSASAESIQKFYDAYAQNKSFYDTWTAKAKDGDVKAMQHIQDLGGPTMFMQLDGIHSVLAEHNQLVRDIYKNPEIAPDEKRQLIDELYFKMIEVARFGNETMGKMKILGQMPDVPPEVSGPTLGIAPGPTPSLQAPAGQ